MNEFGASECTGEGLMIKSRERGEVSAVDMMTYVLVQWYGDFRLQVRGLEIYGEPGRLMIFMDKSITTSIWDVRCEMSDVRC